MTDAISWASRTMAQCTNALTMHCPSAKQNYDSTYSLAVAMDASWNRSVTDMQGHH